jgi:hypothetical protein
MGKRGWFQIGAGNQHGAGGIGVILLRLLNDQHGRIGGVLIVVVGRRAIWGEVTCNP